jgi:hypothetical protein
MNAPNMSDAPVTDQHTGVTRRGLMGSALAVGGASMLP